MNGEGKIKEALEKEISKAEEVLNDNKKTEKILEDVKSRIDKSSVDDILKPIKLLYSLFKDYIKGDYKEIPISTILSVIGALIYFLNPLDLVPDVLPVIGQLDDVSVAYFCIRGIKNDIDKYEKWLEKNI